MATPSRIDPTMVKVSTASVAPSSHGAAAPAAPAQRANL
jgi:hypothetical protein